MVSMMGVIGWCSAKPRSHGVIESVGTKEGLKKISSSRRELKAPAPRSRLVARSRFCGRLRPHRRARWSR